MTHDRRTSSRSSDDELRLIRTTPGATSQGKPFDRLVAQKVKAGEWRLECVSARVLGLSRPLEIYRAERKTDLIKPWSLPADTEAYCPAH